MFSFLNKLQDRFMNSYDDEYYEEDYDLDSELDDEDLNHLDAYGMAIDDYEEDSETYVVSEPDLEQSDVLLSAEESADDMDEYDLSEADASAQIDASAQRGERLYRIGQKLRDRVQEQVEEISTRGRFGGKKMDRVEQPGRLVMDVDRDVYVEHSTYAMYEVQLSNFEDIKEICAAIKHNDSVICTMSGVEANLANQFICYLNGFCNALDASINKIAAATFVLTPKIVRYVKASDRVRERQEMEAIRRRQAM